MFDILTLTSCFWVLSRNQGKGLPTVYIVKALQVAKLASAGTFVAFGGPLETLKLFRVLSNAGGEC